MFTDPQTITTATVARVMPLISREGTHSFYQMGDMTYSLDIKHRKVVRNKNRRDVHLVTFTQRKIVTNPLDSSNDYDTLSESVQFDRPEVGFTSTELTDNWTGFKTWFDSATAVKIFNRES